MHLFYYQQGLFADEVEDEEPAAEPPPFQIPSRVGSGQAQPKRVRGPVQSQNAVAQQAILRGLRSQFAALEKRLEPGVLQREKEELENKVLKMQEELVNLQTEFKSTKDSFTGRLEVSSRALEEQQASLLSAERRVFCTEDLVRFHEDQRRMMAGHFKAQCQSKEDKIRHLNIQLTEYTIDWAHLGMQRHTEASLSHEHKCLQDRHSELLALQHRRRGHLERLMADLQVDGDEDAEAVIFTSKLRQLEADCASLNSQQELLKRWHSASPEQIANPERAHECIWRDELDVREGQLEKITGQLDRTNAALHSTQGALAAQRTRHDEIKAQHQDAEARLREAQRRKSVWQARCAELRRVEDELRRSLQAALSTSSSGFHAGVKLHSGSGGVLTVPNAAFNAQFESRVGPATGGAPAGH